MTNVPATKTATQKAPNAFRLNFVKYAAGIVRCLSALARGLIKPLMMVPNTLGRAFEMAYVDPFSEGNWGQQGNRER